MTAISDAAGQTRKTNCNFRFEFTILSEERLSEECLKQKHYIIIARFKLRTYIFIFFVEFNVQQLIKKKNFKKYRFILIISENRMCYAHITGIHAGTVIGNGYLTFDGKWYNNRGMKISYPTPALLILRVLIFLYTLLIFETRRVPIDNFDDSTPNDNSRLFKFILKYIMFKFKILFNKTWNLVRV